MKKALAVKEKLVPEFANIIKINKGKSFAEATVHSVWGIGLCMADKDKENVSKWSKSSGKTHQRSEIN